VRGCAIRDVDDRDAREPATREELVAAAHRVVEGVIAAARMRRLAAPRMLTRHPPARDLARLRRIPDVVDDQDVAHEARHFGRDIGIALVEVETVDAARMGLDERDQLGARRIGEVVDAKAAVRIGGAVSFAGLDLGIHHHEIADDAHLVGVRPGMRGHELRQDSGLPRVRNIEDRGPLRPMLMSHKGELPLDHDLSAARNLHAREMADIVGRIGQGIRLPALLDNLRHLDLLSRLQGSVSHPCGRPAAPAPQPGASTECSATSAVLYAGMASIPTIRTAG
jgi:hypothetical protein